ncbi:hypothetical protein EJW92_12990 [Enterococcus faecium]|nr:hypothetical protein [Enterococcus faecium]
MFTWLFLLLDAGQFFSQSLNKRCSISCPSVLAQKRQNMKNYFSVCFSNTQDKTLISQPLFLFSIDKSFSRTNASFFR